MRSRCLKLRVCILYIGWEWILGLLGRLQRFSKAISKCRTMNIIGNLLIAWLIVVNWRLLGCWWCEIGRFVIVRNQLSIVWRRRRVRHSFIWHRGGEREGRVHMLHPIIRSTFKIGNMTKLKWEVVRRKSTHYITSRQKWLNQWMMIEKRYESNAPVALVPREQNIIDPTSTNCPQMATLQYSPLQLLK